MSIFKKKLINFFILLLFCGNGYGKQDSFFDKLLKIGRSSIAWLHKRSKKQESKLMHDSAILLLYPLLQQGNLDKKTKEQFAKFCHYASQTFAEGKNPYKYLIFNENETIKKLHQVIEQHAPKKGSCVKYKKSPEKLTALAAMVHEVQQVKLLKKEEFEILLSHVEESQIPYLIHIYCLNEKKFYKFLRKAEDKLIFISKKGFTYFDYESYFKKRKKWFDICAEIIRMDEGEQLDQLHEEYRIITTFQQKVNLLKPGLEKKYGDFRYMDKVDNSIKEISDLANKIERFQNEDDYEKKLNMLKAIASCEGNTLHDKYMRFAIQNHPDKNDKSSFDAAIYSELKRDMQNFDMEEQQEVINSFQVKKDQIDNLGDEAKNALTAANLFQNDYQQRNEKSMPIRRYLLVSSEDLINRTKFGNRQMTDSLGRSRTIASLSLEDKKP